MQPHVDSTFVGVPASSPSRPRIHGLLATLGLMYFSVMALGVNRVLPIFATLFIGVGVDVPRPTVALLSAPSWFLPAAFALGAILIITKASVGLSRPQLRIVNYALLLIGAVLPAAIIFLLNLPLFALLVKLILPR
jgi:hypothetical protein